MEIAKPSGIKIYDDLAHFVFEYDEENGCAGKRLNTVLLGRVVQRSLEIVKEMEILKTNIKRRAKNLAWNK